MAIDPNQYDRFVLRQRIQAVINRYEISVAGPNGEPGEPVCFVEQARFKFKEDIRFYTDDSKQVELMRLKARQRFDPRARYDVTDDRGEKIGESRRSSARACCAPPTSSTTRTATIRRGRARRACPWRSSGG